MNKAIPAAAVIAFLAALSWGALVQDLSDYSWSLKGFVRADIAANPSPCAAGNVVAATPGPSKWSPPSPPTVNTTIPITNGFLRYCDTPALGCPASSSLENGLYLFNTTVCVDSPTTLAGLSLYANDYAALYVDGATAALAKYNLTAPAPASPAPTAFDLALTSGCHALQLYWYNLCAPSGNEVYITGPTALNGTPGVSIVNSGGVKTGPAARCGISGLSYAFGQRNPQNACLACTPTSYLGVLAWSSAGSTGCAPDGLVCSAEDFCQDDVCGPKRAGVALSGVNGGCLPGNGCYGQTLRLVENISWSAANSRCFADMCVYSTIEQDARTGGGSLITDPFDAVSTAEGAGFVYVRYSFFPLDGGGNYITISTSDPSVLSLESVLGAVSYKSGSSLKVLAENRKVEFVVKASANAPGAATLSFQYGGPTSVLISFFSVASKPKVAACGNGVCELDPLKFENPEDAASCCQDCACAPGGACLGGTDSNLVSMHLKKTIMLSPATPAAGFQVKVTLTPSNFVYSRAAADGSDLRFGDSAGNVLPYWVESWNSSGSSVVWVKAAGAGTDRIFLYYGNPGGESDGGAVFDFFDGFDGTGLDTAKWLLVNPTGWSVGGGELKGTSTTGRLKSVFGFSSPLVMETKSRTVSRPTNGVMIAGFYQAGNDAVGYNQHPANDYYYANGFSGPLAVSGSSPLLTKITASPTQAALIVSDFSSGASVLTMAAFAKTLSSAPITIGKRYDYFESTSYDGQAYEAYWDWIRVRKYAASEPVATVSLADEVDWSTDPGVSESLATPLEDTWFYLTGAQTANSTIAFPLKPSTHYVLSAVVRNTSPASNVTVGIKDSACLADDGSLQGPCGCSFTSTGVADWTAFNCTFLSLASSRGARITLGSAGGASTVRQVSLRTLFANESFGCSTTGQAPQVVGCAYRISPDFSADEVKTTIPGDVLSLYVDQSQTDSTCLNLSTGGLCVWKFLSDYASQDCFEYNQSISVLSVDATRNLCTIGEAGFSPLNETTGLLTTAKFQVGCPGISPAGTATVNVNVYNASVPAARKYCNLTANITCPSTNLGCVLNSTAARGPFAANLSLQVTNLPSGIQNAQILCGPADSIATVGLNSTGGAWKYCPETNYPATTANTTIQALAFVSDAFCALNLTDASRPSCIISSSISCPPSNPYCRLNGTSGYGPFSTDLSVQFYDLPAGTTSATVKCNASDAGASVPITGGIAHRTCGAESYPAVASPAMVLASAASSSATPITCSLGISNAPLPAVMLSSSIVCNSSKPNCAVNDSWAVGPFSATLTATFTGAPSVSSVNIRCNSTDAGLDVPVSGNSASRLCGEEFYRAATTDTPQSVTVTAGASATVFAGFVNDLAPTAVRYGEQVFAGGGYGFQATTTSGQYYAGGLNFGSFSALSCTSGHSCWVGSWGDSVSWVQYQFALTSGTHTISIRYHDYYCRYFTKLGINVFWRNPADAYTFLGTVSGDDVFGWRTVTYSFSAPVPGLYKVQLNNLYDDFVSACDLNLYVDYVTVTR